MPPLALAGPNSATARQGRSPSGPDFQSGQDGLQNRPTNWPHVEIAGVRGRSPASGRRGHRVVDHARRPWPGRRDRLLRIARRTTRASVPCAGRPKAWRDGPDAPARSGPASAARQCRWRFQAVDAAGNVGPAAEKTVRVSDFSPASLFGAGLSDPPHSEPAPLPTLGDATSP